jgi:anti-sigma factor RsiW
VSRLEHLRYRRYVDAHVDGELAGDLAGKVADHVARCPMCGREAELTVHVKHSLARRRGLTELTELAAARMRHWVRRRDLS